MAREYRLNLRFNLSDPEQRRVAEFLDGLDRKQYGSRNAFVTRAILAYLDGQSFGEDALVDKLREVIREEIGGLQAVSVQPTAPQTFSPELTPEEQQKNDDGVMDDLALFG